MSKQIKVVETTPGQPPAEVIAEAIVSISKGVQTLLNSRLNRKAVELLIVNACPSYGQYPAKKPGLNDVRSVLDGIASLEKTYLKPQPVKKP